MNAEKSSSGIRPNLIESAVASRYKDEAAFASILSQGNYYQTKYSSPYTLSGCDSNDRFTLRCGHCISTMIAGTDKNEQHLRLSALTHLSPAIIGTSQQQFRREYLELLQEIRRRTISGTVVSGLAGGRYRDTDAFGNYRKQYRSMVQLVGSMTFNELGIDTTVLAPPKFQNARGGETHVFYETQRNTAHIIQPPTMQVPPFSYTQLPEFEEKWAQCENWYRIWLRIKNSTVGRAIRRQIYSPC